MNPITRDEKYPLELYEANNAVRIAQQAGAEKYASDIYGEAMLDLKNATDILSGKKPRSEDGDYVCSASGAAGRGCSSCDAAQAGGGAAAGRGTGSAACARRRHISLLLQAARGSGGAGTGRCGPSSGGGCWQCAGAGSAGRQAGAARVRTARRAARERLLAQLNSVLATSESARGLIVNMSDVLFDTGKYTLKPATQISLAKVSGILQAYPGLKLQVEGYTDSTGSPEFNQKLSENRAGRCGTSW